MTPESLQRKTIRTAIMYDEYAKKPLLHEKGLEKRLEDNNYKIKDLVNKTFQKNFIIILY
jgi:hypothetical protein